MHDARRQLVELEQDLHLALGREDELFMVYQPVLRTAGRLPSRRWPAGSIPGLG
jgi:hypothetical protein